MAEKKWSEGPWWFDKTDYPGLEDTVVEGCGRIRGKCYTVCQLADMNKDEEAANAHLIAAAPELYEALEGLSRAYKALPGSATAPGSWLSHAEAAMEKARGESQ